MLLDRIFRIVAGLTCMALFTAGDSRAVELSCGRTVLRNLVAADYGQGIEFDILAFAPSKKILFLSDGVVTKERHVVLGDYLHQVYPDKVVVSTDFTYQGIEKKGNFTRMHLDNTKPFPFDDNSFDTIILRNGLCLCHGPQCCAGFIAQGEDAKQFFREVVRVMDKNHSTTRVVLEGGYKVTPHVQETWKNLLRQIERETNVRATMHYLNNGEMHMISFKPLATKQ